MVEWIPNTSRQEVTSSSLMDKLGLIPLTGMLLNLSAPRLKRYDTVYCVLSHSLTIFYQSYAILTFMSLGSIGRA
jgi:hypothetical protein